MNTHKIISQDFVQYIETLSYKLESDNDRDFLKRTWGVELPIYKKRLEALNFKNLDYVLDAGCGYGQWSAALINSNKKVTGIDINPTRIDIAKNLAEYFKYDNLNFEEGTVESTHFKDNALDGIFSYSVIYNTDYRNYLREFHRILKPNGLLYFSTNGLGWYIDSLINNTNTNNNFSPSDSAIEAIENSLNFYATGECIFGQPLIMKSDIVRKELKEIGFEVIEIGPDASINQDIHGCKSFFKPDFRGHEYVWEALCKKI